MKICGFELVLIFIDKNLLFKCEIVYAVGYDLKVVVCIVIVLGEIVLVLIGVKVYMQLIEVFYFYDCFLNFCKKGLVLINLVGVIDGDYYGNIGNEGYIFV